MKGIIRYSALLAVFSAAAVAQQVPAPTSLASVHRIYVNSFGDDAPSKLFQATVVDALVASKRFLVTENKDRADAVIEGSGIERTSHEVHAFGEGTAVGTGAAAARVSADSTGATGAAAAVHREMAASDSSLDTETVQHATVALRLVDKEGDVLWSATRSSDGGKYAGATADAVDLCVRQLIRDAAPAAPAKI